MPKRDEAIKTKRWNDPIESDDGVRVLVCRYRPRGVRKEDEPWDVWMPDLGPSRELHAAYYGKHGPPITWSEYARRYLTELKRGRMLVSALAERVRRRDPLTLLCSSACLDPDRCHRTLLRDVLLEEASRGRRPTAPDEAVRSTYPRRATSTRAAQPRPSPSVRVADTRRFRRGTVAGRP